MGLGTPLLSDDSGITIAKNAVRPGNGSISRKELTPEFRECIQRDRLRAITPQRRKKVRASNGEDSG
jgi:hypothetical protein